MPRNESKGELTLALLARQRLPERPSERAHVTSAYAITLRATWEQLAVLIGDSGARAVFERSLQLTRGRAPSARVIALTEAGLSLERLAGATEIDPPEIVLDALCETIGEVVTSLIGTALFATIVRDTAQRLARDERDTGQGSRSDNTP